MDRNDIYDPQEFYYNSAEEDGEDDIVYVENGKRDADSTLQWTTTSTSQAPNDDDATQRSAGSQSQFSQSRSVRNSLPSLITRRERRLMRRQQVGRQAPAVDSDEEVVSRSASENESQSHCDRDVEEDGDEIFASIRDFMDETKNKGNQPFNQISDGRIEQRLNDLDDAELGRKNKANLDSSADGGVVHMGSSHNDDDDAEQNCSQFNKAYNYFSMEEANDEKGDDESHASRKALATNDDRIPDPDNDGRVLASKASFTADSSPKRNHANVCDSESSIVQEPGNQYDTKECSQASVEVDPRERVQVQTSCTRVRHEFSSSRTSDDDDRSTERIMRQAKKHTSNRSQKKHQEDLVAVTNDSDEFLESRNNILVSARRDHQRRQKRSSEEKVKNARNVSRTRDEQTHMAEAKSIVGSRPSHWSGSSINSSTSSKRFCSSNPTSARAAALSQATRMRIRPPPSRSEVSSQRRKHRHENAKPTVQSPAGADTQKERSIRKCKNRLSSVPRLSQSSAATSNNQRTDRGSGWKQNADIRSAEFAPSFLARPRNSQVEPFVVESNTSPTKAAGGMSPFRSEAANYSNLSKYTPRSSRGSSSRKRKKSGLLMTKLRRIRCSVDGDAVRFQSGAYPFQQSKRKSDLNDPRNRAESYADVSIVGEPLPWNGGEKRVTVLGYVHFASSKKTVGLKASGSHPNSGYEARSKCNRTEGFDKSTTVVRESLPDFPCFLWVCFTFDTAHEKKIGRGINLRVYNAIVIHPRCDAESLPTMLCTQICELYPKALPSLPTPPKYAN